MKDYKEIRKEADLWASEWAIKQRNRKIIKAVVIVLVIIAVNCVVTGTKLLLTRAQFSSADAMKQAMQGRYMCGELEEMVIDGDQLIITYYNVNEGVEDAEYNEYTGSALDDTYTIDIVKWNNLTGEIITDWGTAIKVNKAKNPIYHNSEYKRQTGPRNIKRPEPVEETAEEQAGDQQDQDAAGQDAADQATEEEQLNQQKEAEINDQLTQEEFENQESEDI